MRDEDELDPEDAEALDRFYNEGYLVSVLESFYRHRAGYDNKNNEGDDNEGSIS